MTMQVMLFKCAVEKSYETISLFAQNTIFYVKASGAYDTTVLLGLIKFCFVTFQE